MNDSTAISSDSFAQRVIERLRLPERNDVSTDDPTDIWGPGDDWHVTLFPGTPVCNLLGSITWELSYPYSIEWTYRTLVGSTKWKADGRVNARFETSDFLTLRLISMENQYDLTRWSDSPQTFQSWGHLAKQDIEENEPPSAIWNVVKDLFSEH